MHTLEIHVQGIGGAKLAHARSCMSWWVHTLSCNTYMHNFFCVHVQCRVYNTKLTKCAASYLRQVHVVFGVFKWIQFIYKSRMTLVCDCHHSDVCKRYMYTWAITWEWSLSRENTLLVQKYTLLLTTSSNFILCRLTQKFVNKHFLGFRGSHGSRNTRIDFIFYFI